MNKTALWTRDFILVNLARISAALVFMMHSSALATYSFMAYDSSASEAGLVVGIFIIGALVSRIFTGRYTEIIGRRKLLIGGNVLMFLISLLYFIPLNVEIFIFMRFWHGVAFGVVTNMTLVVGTTYIPEDRWGEGMALFSLGMTLSLAIGPFIGLTLLQEVSPEAMFVFSSFCCFLSLFFASFLKVKETPPEERTVLAPGFRITDYVEMKAVPLSFLLMVWGICYSGVSAFVNTYAGLIGIAAFVPAFFALHSLANAVSRIPMGKLYDKTGENVIIIPCLGLFVLSLVLLAFFASPVSLMLVGLFSGLGYGGLFFLAQTIALGEAPAHRMGVAVSTFFVFADAGAGLGPLVMGLIHPFSGYSGMYAIAAIIVVLTVPAYVFMHGRKAKKNVKDPAEVMLDGDREAQTLD